MSQRLSSLLNTSIKSSIRTGGRQQRATTIRSYATHQEQDPKPPSSATPLILAGALALGGYVYYSSNKGSKEADPSDVSGQQFQKKADQEIAKRTDAQNTVNIRGQSPSTIQNETKELSGHPVATKKNAYVDPSTEKNQQAASGSDSSSLSDLKQGAQEEWDKAKQEAERTMRSWENSAQEAKTTADTELGNAKKSVDSVVDSLEQSAVDAKNKVQATWDQAATTASDRADETKQAVSSTKGEWNRLSSNASDVVEYAKDQANAVWNQVSGDASEKVDEAKDQVKDAQSGLENAEQKAREKAGDIKDSLSK